MTDEGSSRTMKFSLTWPRLVYGRRSYTFMYAVVEVIMTINYTLVVVLNVVSAVMVLNWVKFHE